MITCRACGGSLRYDIESSQMKCDYCGQMYDPYSFEESGSAQESQEMDVTIFTCPSCGAQLGSVETSAAEFCSFCGSPVVLTQRLGKMKRPKYIIPFRKTKEDCQAALTKKLRSAFFVPNDFKKASVESFRGIYMPYWNYQVKQKGMFNLYASRAAGSRGDYDYTDHFRINGEIDAEYEGIPHDASEAFSDRISESLEPYEYKTSSHFSQGFLAGFYADIQDVEPEVYEDDAIALANRKAREEVLAQSGFSDRELDTKLADEKRRNTFSTEVTSVECTMVPVWFLAFRKNDRVAYAAVNGESGKVMSDLPLDMKKIWLMIPLMAVPVFFLLNLLLSITATTLLTVALDAAGLGSILYLYELYVISRHEENTNTIRAVRKKSHGKSGFLNFGSLNQQAILKWVVIGVIAGGTLVDFAADAFSAVVYLPLIFSVAVPVYGIWKGINKRDSLEAKPANAAVFWVLLAATAISAVIGLYWHPVSDAWYYAGALLSFGTILLMVVRILRLYNLFTTRPLPQFETGREE